MFGQAYPAVFYPRDVITHPEVLNCGLVQDKEVSLVAAVSH